MSAKRTVYTRTLERAVQILGTRALAEALGVRVGVLQLWLNGQAEPGADAFLKAVDIVTGPLEEREAPIIKVDSSADLARRDRLR